MPPKKTKDKSEWYIVIGDNIIYHGDKIIATIEHTDENDEHCELVIEDARLCINSMDKDASGLRRAWICQNLKNGCTEAEEKFGYKYSWVFSVNEDNQISSDDTLKVIPAKQANEVKINGEVFTEGEMVVVTIHKGGGKWGTTVARLNIMSSRKLCLCQDFAAGCSEFRYPNTKEKALYGYSYGWHVEIRDGKIISPDTQSIHKIPAKSKPVEAAKKEYVDDDDMMPADWVPTEKDLEFLKFIQQ